MARFSTPPPEPISTPERPIAAYARSYGSTEVIAVNPDTVTGTEGGSGFAGLQAPQRRIEPAAGDEVVVRAALDDAAGVEHVDRIGLAYRR